ncbi:uncharacterized protein DUF2635 [Pseudomonas sp. SJZ080]|uniref:DUF2635 domain-containing protein n=1 Tax=Pseudomonas sp. SJZ080 TaxID=2572888 RepID=UPI001198E31D|nr:DUF2635 domain-containing protein [Pseudomonas sp. SJZ080]TWC57605.1 uncharacterized protein DUF2635 [Pseudomonas sp. SJZ080]
MKRIYLKPVAGRACPDPDKGGALLPDKGADVPHTVYWQRRISAGDAVLAEPEDVPLVETPPVKKGGAKAAAAASAGGEQ